MQGASDSPFARRVMPILHRVVVESGFACEVSGIPAALYAWTRYRLFNLCLDTPSYPPSIFKNRVELHPCADLTVPPFHALVRFCEAMHRYVLRGCFRPFRLRMVDPNRSLEPILSVVQLAHSGQAARGGCPLHNRQRRHWPFPVLLDADCTDTQRLPILGSRQHR